MKKELKKVLDERIVHETFLNKSDLLKAVEDSYNLGLNESRVKYEKLKSAFESLLKLWCDFGKYDCSKNKTENEWKKDAGIK